MATQITELYPRHFVNTSYTHDPSTTLYTFWIGINDINQSAEWNDTSTLDDRLMAQYRVLLVRQKKKKGGVRCKQQQQQGGLIYHTTTTTTLLCVEVSGIVGSQTFHVDQCASH